MLISHLKINMSAYSKTIHYLKDKVHVVLSNWVMKPRYTCFPPRTSLQVPSWPFRSSLVAEHQLIAFRNSLARLIAASAGGGAAQAAHRCLPAAHPQLKVTNGRTPKAACSAWPPRAPALWWASLWLAFAHRVAVSGKDILSGHNCICSLQLAPASGTICLNLD